MGAKRYQAAGLVMLLAVVFAAETVGLHNIYTTRNPGANDLLPRWVGTRAWLLEGRSPYDPVVEQRGQEIIYRRPASRPGEDLARFLYFPYAMIFFLPIALLSYAWAQAAWMTTLQFCLAAMVFVAFRLYRWSPRPWLAGLIALWAIVAYPGARAILLGQLTIVMALLTFLGLWAIRERRDALAGILLALATAKPTLAVPLTPLIFIWSLTARRWKLAASLGGALAALAAFSFAVAPDWMAQVARQAQGYTMYTDIGSVVSILTHEAFPLLGNVGEFALSAVLIGWMVWEWWLARGDHLPPSTLHTPRFDRAVAVTLVVTLLISPRTGTTSQPLLYPVLIMLFAWLSAARPGGGLGYIVLTLLVTAVGLWVLFLLTIRGRLEQPPVFLPLPIGLAGALWLARPKALE